MRVAGYSDYFCDLSEAPTGRNHRPHRAAGLLSRLLLPCADGIAGRSPRRNPALERGYVRKAKVLQDERRTGAGGLVRSGADRDDGHPLLHVGSCIGDYFEGQRTGPGDVSLRKR